MKVRIRSWRTGDSIEDYTPEQVLEQIVDHPNTGPIGFVKFSDGSTLSVTEEELAKRTGILDALREKERAGLDADLVPVIAGG